MRFFSADSIGIYPNFFFSVGSESHMTLTGPIVLLLAYLFLTGQKKKSTLDAEIIVLPSHEHRT